MGIYKSTTPKYSLGDYVWEDSDKDGIQDPNESGVGGVTVKLLDSSGKLVGTTTTGNDGKYQFDNLENGDYRVEFTPPAGYNITTPNSGDDALDSDADSKGVVAKATIKDANNFTIDMGIYKSTTPITTKYSLGDYIWYDDNHNGVQDSNEKGVSGVKVTLSNGATTTTDSNGYYKFTGLSNGDYFIIIDTNTLPSGYQLTSYNSGNDDSKDSDVNPSTAQSDIVKIQNADNLSLDVGIYRPTTPKYSLGDFVWYDENRNGIQDIGETGISEVKVKLFNSNGNLIGTTKTDSDGKYQFNNLDNGEYRVQFEVLDGYKVTDQNGGDNALDSDADSKGVVSKAMIKDASNFTIDMGLYKPDTTVVTPPPVEESTEPKIDIEKYLNGKDADSESQAVPLVEGDSITWEYVISNIGDETVTNIKVIDDKEGEIICPKTTLVSATKMICTKTGTAKDARYHNIATVTGKGENSGKDTSDSDGSWYVTKYLIGTHFWIDTNKDGIYQEGLEEPIPHALVELFDANGNKVAQTYTDENGEYRFYVDAGDYYVKFHLPEDFKKKGYIFDQPKGNDKNEVNVNNANEQGFTKVVGVGPDADPEHKIANLTLDGAINCGCDAPGIEQGSGDAFSRFVALLMFIFTSLLALRRIEETKIN